MECQIFFREPSNRIISRFICACLSETHLGVPPVGGVLSLGTSGKLHYDIKSLVVSAK